MRDDGGILASCSFLVFVSAVIMAFWLGLGGKKSKEKEKGRGGEEGVYLSC